MTVEQQIADIKAHMPEVYKDIQAKAAVMGKPAYALVRRGLRGVPNCFYAFEKGRVVGTPFNVTDIMADVAVNMVQFGLECAVVWPIGGQSTPVSASASTAASIGTPTPPLGTPTAGSHAGNSTPSRAPVAGPGQSPVSSPKAGG